jgi:hypothetical protein
MESVAGARWHGDMGRQAHPAATAAVTRVASEAWRNGQATGVGRRGAGGCLQVWGMRQVDLRGSVARSACGVAQRERRCYPTTRFSGRRARASSRVNQLLGGAPVAAERERWAGKSKAN